MTWIHALPSDLRKRVRRVKRPEWIVPMAATLTKDRFDDPDWVFEKKLDGIRYLAFVSGGRARLLTRNRIQHLHPEVEAALVAQPSKDFVVDGEMVAYSGERSGFLLRGESDVRVEYDVFDVMRLDGYDVTQLPLDERRRLLEERFDMSAPLALVSRLDEDGLAAYERARREGWEGVIAKLRDSVYEHKRSKAWLKMKCDASQELVVGGFTEPKGSRTGLGALLVGFYDGDDFVYAGRLGTGFSSKLLTDLRARLERLEIDKPPFTRGVGIPRKNAHWVRPEVVVQAAFMEWTSDNKLRHPRLVGIREDKAARDVVREA